MRRRSLLVGTAVTLAAAGAGVHVLRGRAAGGEVRRPPGVPVGPFGRDSTAEEDCGPVVPAPGKHMDDIDLAERAWARSQFLVKEYLA